ncbi:hypothetical protein RND71_027509 [Anisodus tanguticus]|uniref:Uncharacterized protein n=1 Tax=Anisodus tanguticus TaxID=243964 RepID=A0AAE1RHR1_9SOLA|nr:hypothetical protein RND71_027509 [Anisodus tanguticus]
MSTKMLDDDREMNYYDNNVYDVPADFDDFENNIYFSLTFEASKSMLCDIFGLFLFLLDSGCKLPFISM